MSNRVEQLEQELKVAQELLFLVLEHIGEPVILDANASKTVMSQDRMIDLQLDDKAGTWTLRTVRMND